jgi:lambda repressor-like predicted transcriptional regulator
LATKKTPRINGNQCVQNFHYRAKFYLHTFSTQYNGGLILRLTMRQPTTETPARRKIARALKRYGATFRDLAYGAGISKATLSNQVSDRNVSHRSRQRITDCLGVRIWPGIEPRSLPPLSFGFGDEIISPSEEQAMKLERQLTGYVRRDGRALRFIKQTPSLCVREAQPATAAAGETRT